MKALRASLDTDLALEAIMPPAIQFSLAHDPRLVQLMKPPVAIPAPVSIADQLDALYLLD